MTDGTTRSVMSAMCGPAGYADLVMDVSVSIDKRDMLGED
jgi:hypothetical protein